MEYPWDGLKQFDVAALEEICNMMGGNTAEILPIIETYQTQSSVMINTLQAAFSENDVEAIRQTAHGLKSSSAALGGEKLACLCQEVERIARQDEEKAPVVFLETLLIEYDAFVKNLSKFPQ